MSRISLLVADVDGTLVTDQKVLTERGRGAVMMLHDRGFALPSPAVGRRRRRRLRSPTMPRPIADGSARDMNDRRKS
jgi:hypothetical protein